MRALFFGTPEIAVRAMEALHRSADLVGVVCQPDKPAGRGLELKPPAVKARALELGVPVHQPTKVRTPDFAEWVRAQEAEVALVMAYGRILPKAVLEAPKRGCMNLHASLLPRYRGAAPITWAVVNGETESGISLMQMDEGMDTGAVFSRHQVAIGDRMTAGELSEELARCAAKVVEEDLLRAVRGELVAIAQDESLATHARPLEKEDGKIDWSRPAKAIHDHVRGMSPWPSAHTVLNGKLFKVLATEVASADESGTSAAPGTVVIAEKNRIEITCGAGRIALLRGQPEGKKPQEARDLVAGRTVAVGARLGTTAG